MPTIYHRELNSIFCDNHMGNNQKKNEYMYTYNWITILVHLNPTRYQLSVQLSCSVMSNSLQPHGLQCNRPPCPSPTPGVYSNSCPLCWWCHPTISSPVISFSSCLQSFPASAFFQKSQFFTSGGQSIGVSVSASVFPMNIQEWFPLGWTGWISLPSKESQESSSTPQLKSINSEEEPRWWRNRTGRPLSPLQIHQQNIWTQSKLHKTTFDR